ncbi:MAG: ABC transporter permease [Bacteroidia bacterium]
MNKVLTIFRREYFNIVKKKSFLLATFLVPLAIIGFGALEVAFLTMVEKGEYTVLIPKEKASIFSEADYTFTNSTDLKFEIVNESIENLEARVGKNKNEIFINPPQLSQIDKYAEGKVMITSSKTVGEPVKKDIKKQIEKRIRAYRIKKEGLTQEQLDKVDFKVSVGIEKVDAGGESKKGIQLLSKGVGGGVGFLMYMLLAIYGSILMQGVIEEKSNRIVEVIVSSVKPFQLLMGKVTALTAVALTQMIIWGVLITVGILIALPFLKGQSPDPQSIEDAQAQLEAVGAGGFVEQLVDEVSRFNWSILLIVPFFFIGGFLIYGSLYAAVGSTVDNVQDAQQFVFPITMPLILGILSVVNITQNPESSLAVWTSHIPFTSPLAMPARMAATSVPWWEVVLSLAFLALGFMACIWVAGKIYRTGILMYGKKPSFKEIFRWIKG